MESGKLRFKFLKFTTLFHNISGILGPKHRVTKHFPRFFFNRVSREG